MSYTSLGDHALGFVVNAALTPGAMRAIGELQRAIRGQFPDVVWTAPPEALHITLLDWFAPLVDYFGDVERLYGKAFLTYDVGLRRILSDVPSLDVTFRRFIVSDTSIVLVGDAASEAVFNDIRHRFATSVDLVPDAKSPPTIVHTSIGRIVGDVSTEAIAGFLETQPIDITTRVTAFRLVRETRVPMLAYDVIKEYDLR